MATSEIDTKKIFPMNNEHINDVLAVYDKLKDLRFYQPDRGVNSISVLYMRLTIL